MKKIYDPIADTDFLVEKSDWAGPRVRQVAKGFHQVPSPQLSGDGGFIHLESTTTGWPGVQGRPGTRGTGQDLKVIRRRSRHQVGGWNGGATALERYGKADRDRKGAAKVGAGIGVGYSGARGLYHHRMLRDALHEASQTPLGPRGAKVAMGGALLAGTAINAGIGAGAGALIGRKRKTQ